MNLVSMPKSPFMKKSIGISLLTVVLMIHIFLIQRIVQDCLMQRNPRWLQATWQLLTEEEKKNYEVPSKNMKSVNVNELNDEQESKLIHIESSFYRRYSTQGKHEYKHLTIAYSSKCTLYKPSYQINLKLYTQHSLSHFKKHSKLQGNIVLVLYNILFLVYLLPSDTLHVYIVTCFIILSK